MPRRPTLFLALLAAGLSTPATAQPPADLELVPTGAPASTAVAMRNAGDGSGRLFVVERNGTIEIFDPSSGLLGTPFLDIVSDVDTFFEGGLLGLAFHPDFGSNRYFYVYYTRTSSPLESVVERFTVMAADPNHADPSSRREIFTLEQPAGNHNGGDIHFGPDGYLYIGLGDGGASSGTSQDNLDLLGKILRIDPCDDEVCVPAYEIPPDNPFVGDPSAADEIWASGLRNPYRWSFDRATGDMFIADVGAGSREEVSFQPAASIGGEDYGWNCREGDIAGPGNCSGTFVEPIIVYGHTSGNCSITGGYRYRGCITGLRGTYVFADFCTARVWFAEEVGGGSWTFSEWDNLAGSIYGFGEDEDGELYLSTGGSILRFESASDCSEVIFADGFESGDTSAWGSTVP
jgi:glucose/arabinose dehydrogenase